MNLFSRGCTFLAFMLCLAPLSAVSAAHEIVVVSSLPKNVAQGARQAFANFFKSDNVLGIYELDKLTSETTLQSEFNSHVLQQPTFVSTGSESCSYLAATVPKDRLLCTLLSLEAYETIFPAGPELRPSAIIIDQPVARQVSLAHTQFPQLKSFSLLANNNLSAGVNDSDDISVNFFQYRNDLSLLPQIKNALGSADALVIVADQSIYSVSNLRTVLLTAYGYGKPVVGFGKAYVRAGALLSAQSSASHIIRQAAEMLKTEPTITQVLSAGPQSPKYFTVESNTSVAKSLNLFPFFSFEPGKTYTDEDFLK